MGTKKEQRQSSTWLRADAMCKDKDRAIKGNSLLVDLEHSMMQLAELKGGRLWRMSQCQLLIAQLKCRLEED